MVSSVGAAGVQGTTGERRRARTVALQALYEIDATSHPPQLVLERRFEDDLTPPGAAEYARSLVQGVREHQAPIDELIVRAAPAWPLEQMSRVDKSILRLALFEMLYVPGVPSRVAINEAVELAKTFGHESAPKFVNGVLGSISRAHTEASDETNGQPDAGAGEPVTPLEGGPGAVPPERNLS
jgi:N utilization substance protein B